LNFRAIFYNFVGWKVKLYFTNTRRELNWGGIESCDSERQQKVSQWSKIGLCGHFACPKSSAKRAHRNDLRNKPPQKRGIGGDETIFVLNEGAKAQHSEPMWAFCLPEEQCKKSPSERFARQRVIS